MPSINEYVGNIQRLTNAAVDQLHAVEAEASRDTISVVSGESADRFTVVANTAGARARLTAALNHRSTVYEENLAHLREVLQSVQIDRTPEELATIVAAQAPNVALNLGGGTGNGATAVLNTTLRDLSAQAASANRSLAEQPRRHSREDLFTMLDEIIADESVTGEAKVRLLRDAVIAARDNTVLREEDNPLLYLAQQFISTLMGARR